MVDTLRVPPGNRLEVLPHDRQGQHKQHLDNVRRKDPLRGAETTEIFVRLGNYSASHFEGSASACFRKEKRELVYGKATSVGQHLVK